MATQNLDLETQEQLDQIKFFWQRYGNLISTIIIVLALSFLAWQYYQRMQQSKADQAAGVYAALLDAATQPDVARVQSIWADLQGKYAGTAFAEQGALLAGAALASDEPEQAKQALTWAIEKGKHASYSSLARLRLASVLAQEGAYEAALQQLNSGLAPEYAALAADRRGDLYALQGKGEQARAEYDKALAAMDAQDPYRGFVQVKHNSVSASGSPAAAEAAPAAAEAAPVATPAAPAAPAP